MMPARLQRDTAAEAVRAAAARVEASRAAAAHELGASTAPLRPDGCRGSVFMTSAMRAATSPRPPPAPASEHDPVDPIRESLAQRLRATERP
jgi:hypothetical protein